MRVKRIAPGYYETADGRYKVVRTHLPGDQFGPAAVVWYWKPVDGAAHDHFATKAEAVEALAAWIAEGP